MVSAVPSCRTHPALIGPEDAPADLFEVEALEQQRMIVSSAVDLLADRIVMAHAKDSTSDGRFATAGKGALDCGHYVRRLASIGFEDSLIAHGLRRVKRTALPSSSRRNSRMMPGAGNDRYQKLHDA
jgi:hypothetical protein